MALGRGCGWREMLSDGIRSKAGPQREVIVVDGVDPCGWWWAECGQTKFVWCNAALIAAGRYYPKTCNWVVIAFKYEPIVVKNFA